MKKLSSLLTVLTVIALSQLISACSQGRYVHNQHDQRSQQRQQYTQQQSPQRTIRPQVTQQTQQNAVFNVHPARNKMVQIATSTIGTPYKWGGDTPQKGFDCSGLMSYVHKNALGMKIPRTTANQRDNSRTVQYQHIQPGDMLFFKTGSRTNHVGVYIGNRKFVHAPSSGKRVTVASMDNAYWHKRFVKFGSFL